MRKGNWVAMLPFYLLTLIIVLGLAAGGSHSVTVLGERRPLERRHTIVIDAGHGGVDGGATSVSGVLEKKINLEIAQRMEQLFHFLGWNTVMVRREDISVYTQGTTIAAKKVSDLRERVRIVNETENAVLLSIHQNTYPNSRYGGPQVFYNSTPSSKALAQALQQQMNRLVSPGSQRAVKRSSGVYLMEHIKNTGVLVECGFLSNPQEDLLLQDAQYQKKLSGAIAVAVCQFLSNT